MKKSIISLAILAFFIATLPFSLAAENSTVFCIDSTHLGYNDTWIMDGITHTYTESSPCAFGCDSQLAKCNPSNWEKNMGVIGDVGMLPLFVIIMLIVLAIIALLKRR